MCGRMTLSLNISSHAIQGMLTQSASSCAASDLPHSGSKITWLLARMHSYMGLQVFLLQWIYKRTTNRISIHLKLNLMHTLRNIMHNYLTLIIHIHTLMCIHI